MPDELDDQELLAVTEPVPDPTPVVVPDDPLLMKHALTKILTFVITMTIAVLVVILRQNEALFLFRFSATNINDGAVFQAVRIFLLGFYLYIGFYLVFFIGVYRKRLRMEPDERAATQETFKKRYYLFDLWTVVPVFVMGLVVLTAFFISPAVVEGSSMETTFSDGDPVLIEHFLEDFDRDEVVIVEVGTELLIKRLIGLPGDDLLVDETGVYIDGELVEDYVPFFYSPGNPQKILYFSYDGTIPEGLYFVMGDNRRHSADSRYFGFVESEDMLGVVWLPAR